MRAPFITVVSGLPRSGTSMMMKMLEAGGIPVVTDGLRAADLDNPERYYEFERVKKLSTGDTAWLPETQGKAVKIISALLPHLPPSYEYRVIFMRRHMEELLASQRQMLLRRGQPTDATDDATMAAHFDKHVRRVAAWLAAQPNVRVLYLDYAEVVSSAPAQVERIRQFLGGDLDRARMAAVIHTGLYRQRRGDTGRLTPRR